MTEEQLNEIISTANNALLVALSDPKPSYKIGEYSVNHNEHIKTLTQTISWATEQLNNLPAEEITIWRPS